MYTEAEEAEVCSFVKGILAHSRVSLMDATALDVGIIHRGGWAIVEQNAPWGAGIYGCDPEAGGLGEGDSGVGGLAVTENSGSLFALP